MGRDSICAAAQFLQRQIHVAQDGGEQVVEVVRDATGKPADGFHFRGLLKLLLQAQLLRIGAQSIGDIAGHAHEGRHPIQLDLTGRHFHGVDRAVLPAMASLEYQVALFCHLAIDVVQVILFVRRGDLIHAHGEKLVTGVAQHAASSIVHLDQLPITKQQEDSIGLKKCAVAQLIAAQGLLGRFAIRDVADVDDDAIHARLPQPIGRQPLPPAVGAVPTQVTPFRAHNLAGKPDQRREFPLHARRSSRCSGTKSLASQAMRLPYPVASNAPMAAAPDAPAGYREAAACAGIRSAAGDRATPPSVHCWRAG